MWTSAVFGLKMQNLGEPQIAQVYSKHSAAPHVHTHTHTHTHRGHTYTGQCFVLFAALPLVPRMVPRTRLGLIYVY